MSLFQNSVVNKYLKGIDKEQVNQAYEKFKSHFHNPAIQENIRNSKEEQYQGEFLIDLFVSILGYTKNPTPNFNLTTELKNVKGAKKTDGAILNEKKALAVIELKGTSVTDLSKVETQAFGYKNNQPGCNYVITSNFEKLRFYIDNAVEFEEFNLFQLSKERFEILWLCLSAEYLLKDLPKKIKDESLSQEETITKKLYKDYASFRNEIFDAIQKENPEHDKLTLFKKTQKLLDRFLFIFFAEDRLLVPPNSIRQILKQWTTLKDELDAYVPLYDRYKKYFGYLNTGHKGKHHDIFAYNGGLFAPDDVLDSITINDDLLYKHTLNLSHYDFESEVSVNILGHIFEHSLNDIEAIQAEIEGVATDSTKTKRKKDGVFYTPKYITKYIVDNTVGKLCEEKKAELNIQEEEYEKERKGRQKATLKKLSQTLEEYRNWLLQLTICDPACGSGAFLNQALEFLIAEHRYIDELQAKLFGDAIVLSEVENAILENNLYGVDINDESVEIAKLSLWLRTAQKGRKLTSLNDNIKCGNSLIDDPEVAGEKAFSWQKEFPKVFAKGGFDVVIGNPPYIKEYTNKQAFDGLHDHYCYQGKMDLWYFFGALALEIVKKEKGLISYIAPNNWITNFGASKFRNIVLERGKLIEFIDFGDFKVFDTAGIQTMIYVMKRTDNNDEYNMKYSKVIDKRIKHEDAQLFLQNQKDKKFEYYTVNINKSEMLDSTINFVSAELSLILNKLKKHQNFDFKKKEIAQGIVAPQDFLNKTNKEKLGDGFKIGDGIFNINNETYSSLNFKTVEKELIKPLYTTNELSRFFGNRKNKLWVIYTGSEFNDKAKIEPYPNIKAHLDKFQNVITSSNKPYGLHRARDERFFKGEKIISLRKCSRPTFTYTDFDCYVSQTFFSIKTKRINLKYLTGLLNSDLIAFWLKYQGKMQGDLYQVDKGPLMEIPVLKPNDEKQLDIAILVDKIIENRQKQIDYQTLFKEAKTANNFEREIQLSKELEAISDVLIDTETQINHKINQLYGLTDEEIAIVEEATAN